MTDARFIACPCNTVHSLKSKLHCCYSVNELSKQPQKNQAGKTVTDELMLVF